MALRTGIALTVGFFVLAAAPITIDVLRHDTQGDAEGVTNTTVYRSHIVEATLHTD